MKKSQPLFLKVSVGISLAAAAVTAGVRAAPEPRPGLPATPPLGIGPFGRPLGLLPPGVGGRTGGPVLPQAGIGQPVSAAVDGQPDAGNPSAAVEPGLFGAAPAAPLGIPADAFDASLESEPIYQAARFDTSDPRRRTSLEQAADDAPIFQATAASSRHHDSGTHGTTSTSSTHSTSSADISSSDVQPAAVKRSHPKAGLPPADGSPTRTSAAQPVSSTLPKTGTSPAPDPTVSPDPAGQVATPAAANGWFTTGVRADHASQTFAALPHNLPLAQSSAASGRHVFQGPGRHLQAA